MVGKDAHWAEQWFLLAWFGGLASPGHVKYPTFIYDSSKKIKNIYIYTYKYSCVKVALAVSQLNHTCLRNTDASPEDLSRLGGLLS